MCVCVLLPLSGYAGGECSLKIIGHIKCDQVSLCVLLPLSGYARGECSWKIIVLFCLHREMHRALSLVPRRTQQLRETGETGEN